jgi:hypothetical protein
MSGNSLVAIESVERRLAVITTVDQAKDLRDKAELIRRYYKNSRRGLEDQNRAALFKFECECRGGELLRAVPKVQGSRDGSEGLLATLERSQIPTTSGYRWMDLAEVPEAEAQLRRLAEKCDQDGLELSWGIVDALLVRPWRERRGKLRFPTTTEEAPSDEDTRSMTRLLTDLDLLRADDLRGLSSSQATRLVQEVHAAYRETCEDSEHGKVAGRNGWNPECIVDRRLLGSLVVEVVSELKAGKIGHADIRKRVNIVERLKGGLPRSSHAVCRMPPLGRPQPLTEGLDGTQPPLRITQSDACEQLVTAARLFLRATQTFIQDRPNLTDKERHTVQNVLAELREALDGKLMGVRE